MLIKAKMGRVHNRVRFSAVRDAHVRVHVNAELETERIVCVDEAAFRGLYMLQRQRIWDGAELEVRRLYAPIFHVLL